HLVPFGLASAREHGLFGAELSFEALGDAHRVVPDRRRVHGLVDRQYIRQENGSCAVGRKRRPTRLERKEIRRYAFGQGGHDRRDNAGYRLASAASISWARKRELAEARA